MRDSLSKLRARGREQTEIVLEAGAALGGAFAYGFTRGKEIIPAQWFGIDTDLMIGGAVMLLGLNPKWKWSGTMRGGGIAILGGWSRDLGFNQAQK